MGVASRDCLSGVAFFQGRVHSDVAAPEDGRTPPWQPISPRYYGDGELAATR
jgi:hypothetical protein